jgi:vancomycin resistance protein YoaR
LKTTERKPGGAPATRIGGLRIRPTRRGWTFVALAALLLASYTADAVVTIGRVRSGVRAGSLQLGGKTRDEAKKLLNERAQLLVSQPVELFADNHRITVSPSEVGFRPDVDTTLDEAAEVGRTGNVIVRLWHRVRSLFASTDVGWASTHDAKAAKLLVSDFASRVDTQGHEAGIETRAAQLVPVGAVPGRLLDREKAIENVIAGLESWPRQSMELPIAIRNRRTTIDDARAAARTANEWTRAPVTLTAPDGTGKTLSREEIAALIDAVPQRRGLDWILKVRFSPTKVKAALGDVMRGFEREPRNATFAVNGTVASVVAGQAGRKFDAGETANRLAEAADRDDDRVARAAFAETDPELSTSEAKALNIHELVSSFTTNHPCCAPRVSNIHKIAGTVNGAIIKPGARFSLNGFVGPRTTEKGYVLAPMIFDGEYRDDVGGGVSQFATTMYNAVFFGGYRIETHKAHTYYISRYPAGREATVSWPAPDMAFTNDSKSGIYVRTSYDNTSITVSFYGDKEKDVSAETGERTNPTQPETQRKENPDLEPGQERVVQQGHEGFDITVVRVIRDDGDETRQNFFTRYKAEPRIIEVGPGEPSASPDPSESPKPRGSRATPPPGPTPQPPTTPRP